MVVAHSLSENVNQGLDQARILHGESALYNESLRLRPGTVRFAMG